MIRLSQKQEEQIKKYIGYHKRYPEKASEQDHMIMELLAEVDALREENQKLQDGSIEPYELLKERLLKETLLRDHIEKLKNRVEKLREAHAYIADRLYSKDLDAAIRSRKALAADDELEKK